MMQTGIILLRVAIVVLCFDLYRIMCRLQIIEGT